MEQNSSNLFELQIDPQTNGFLAETAKWAKFLAIVGFVFCGLMALGALFAGSVIATSFSQFGGAGAMAAMGSTFVTIFYLGLALLCFFPCLYLFKFATKMKVALRSNDQETINNSFGNLKSYFKFVGILTIIILSFYAIILLIVLAAGASRL
jgi:hypothetical protein